MSRTEKSDGRLPPLGRRFGFLFGVTGSSNLADGMLLVGVPLLALTFTQSPALISLLSAALTLPWLLLALHVGVLVDRCDRVAVLSAATAVRVVVLAIAALMGAMGALSMPALIALLLVLGIAEVFADSAANVLVPAVVPRSRLGAANSRVLGVQQLMNAFVGGPLAGLVLGLGAGWFFGFPAGLCILSLVLIRFGLRGRVSAPPTPETKSSAAADIREGLRFLFGHEVLRPLLIASTLMNFANAGYFAVFVLWVVGPGSAVSLDSSLYGLLLAAVAAGALLGAALTEWLQRHVRDARLLGTTWVINSFLLVIPVIVPNAWAIGAAFALVGFTNMVSNVVYQSMRQRLVPDGLRGRIGGAARMLAYGSMPIGAAFAGVVGEVTGVATVLVGAAAVALLSVTWGVSRVPQRKIDAADVVAEERDDPTPQEQSPAQTSKQKD